MDETLATIQMPRSLPAEQSVVGAMITDERAIMKASEILTPGDFYHRQYAVMFETMVELYDAGKPIDVVTLLDELKKKDAPEEILSLQALGELASAVPVTVNIESYANIVKDKAMLRKIIDMNRDIEKLCLQEESGTDEILDITESKFLELLQRRGVEDFVPIEDVVMNALNKIEEVSRLSGNVTGIPTGFIDLDTQTAGMQPSDLILVAARPSMGKTAFALNIAEYVAIHEDETVAIFSLEMSKEQLVNRLFSLESRVDSQKLRTGKLTDADWESLIEGASNVGKSSLIIDDTPSISVSELRSKCRKYKQEKDLKLVMIDYLQLMTVSGKSESRQQEISEISRSLKALARELNVPVIALSQLNRGVEQREDKRPMLSDLRDSGAIEQDADVVMFIYRDDYYNHDTPRKDISEIIVAKQRNGPVGTVELAWLSSQTRFANLEKRHTEN